MGNMYKTAFTKMFFEDSSETFQQVWCEMYNLGHNQTSLTRGKAIANFIQVCLDWEPEGGNLAEYFTEDNLVHAMAVAALEGLKLSDYPDPNDYWISLGIAIQAWDYEELEADPYGKY